MVMRRLTDIHLIIAVAGLVLTVLINYVLNG